LKLPTRPAFTGSGPTEKTIGMVEVASLAASRRQQSPLLSGSRKTWQKLLIVRNRRWPTLI
jgi:hypothetical protein